MSYYKNELKRLKHTEYAKTLVVNSEDEHGLQSTKYLSLNAESIPVIIKYLNDELKRLKGDEK